MNPKKPMLETLVFQLLKNSDMNLNEKVTASFAKFTRSRKIGGACKGQACKHYMTSFDQGRISEVSQKKSEERCSVGAPLKIKLAEHLIQSSIFDVKHDGNIDFSINQKTFVQELVKDSVFTSGF